MPGGIPESYQQDNGVADDTCELDSTESEDGEEESTLSEGDSRHTDGRGASGATPQKSGEGGGLKGVDLSGYGDASIHLGDEVFFFLVYVADACI